MLEKFILLFSKLIDIIPFTAATWFVLFTIIFFVWLFSKAHKNPVSPVRWEHLVISTTTNRADPYKIGYLIGTVVSTWIIIGLFDKDKLSFDIFGLYLAYLVGGAGWNMVASKRQSINEQENRNVHAKQTTENVKQDVMNKI